MNSLKIVNNKKNEFILFQKVWHISESSFATLLRETNSSRPAIVSGRQEYNVNNIFVLFLQNFLVLFGFVCWLVEMVRGTTILENFQVPYTIIWTRKRTSFVSYNSHIIFGHRSSWNEIIQVNWVHLFFPFHAVYIIESKVTSQWIKDYVKRVVGTFICVLYVHELHIEIQSEKRLNIIIKSLTFYLFFFLTCVSCLWKFFEVPEKPLLFLLNSNITHTKKNQSFPFLTNSFRLLAVVILSSFFFFFFCVGERSVPPLEMCWRVVMLSFTPKSGWKKEKNIYIFIYT